MIDLDDLQALHALDRGGMLDHLKGFADQCRRGWETAVFHLPNSYRKVDHVILAGMGGSAMAGEVLAGLAALEEAPLLHVHRDYDLPLWAGEGTLAVVSSYSGITEEALSSFEWAQARGLKTLAVTSGGTLAERALAQGVPLYSIPIQAPPRVTLGYTLLSLLRIFVGLGLLSEKTQDIREMEQVLPEMEANLGAGVPTAQNPAKRLARELHGRVPLIIGSGNLSGAARRWKSQINENAKTWAFAETLPELDHNTVVASEAAPELRDRVFAVFLRGSSIPERLQARHQQTEVLLKEHQVPSSTVQAWGTSPLVQVLTAILYGDWVSFYLAALNDVDPTPVVPIDLLKRRLKETRPAAHILPEEFQG